MYKRCKYCGYDADGDYCTVGEGLGVNGHCKENLGYKCFKYEPKNTSVKNKTKEPREIVKGVIICGIEMPKDCIECPCHNSENGQCNILKIVTDYIPRECPMHETQILK